MQMRLHGQDGVYDKIFIEYQGVEWVCSEGNLGFAKMQKVGGDLQI